MVHFPPFAPHRLCIHRMVSQLPGLGFPIRTSPDYRLLASPRGLSQLATSFIAYLRQGIHTHALSSLTIKLTLRFTQTSSSPRITSQSPLRQELGPQLAALPSHIGLLLATTLQLVVARQ